MAARSQRGDCPGPLPPARPWRQVLGPSPAQPSRLWLRWRASRIERGPPFRWREIVPLAVKARASARAPGCEGPGALGAVPVAVLGPGWPGPASGPVPLGLRPLRARP